MSTFSEKVLAAAKKELEDRKQSILDGIKNYLAADDPAVGGATEKLTDAEAVARIGAVLDAMIAELGTGVVVDSDGVPLPEPTP